jgi:hypothetical protein
LPRGTTFRTPDVLFAKIEDGAREGWEAQFAGAAEASAPLARPGQN